MISLFKVFMSEKVKEEVPKILTSGYITQGKKVEEFEQKLIELFNYPYILTLNSATSGLTLALRLIKDKMNLASENEVLTTPLTCMATNEPILANNLKIKWVDVNRDNCLIDLEDLERKITKNTKIIVFVHWGGYPLDLDALNNILDRKEQELGFRILVVEDCAHGFLSEYKGKKIGTSGNYCVFSTQAIKHLTTGDGGLIFLPSKEEYERAKLLRWFGIDRNKRNYKIEDFRLEYNVEDWGYKFHMNDINATVGLCNLPHVQKNISKCRENAKFLTENYKDGKVLHPYNEEYKSSYWLFTVLVENKREYITKMKKKGVMVSQVHQRNDVHDCFKKFKTELPNLDYLEKHLLCIPCGWWLDKKDLMEIYLKC
jgi:dTDP-4-amino-4,6-dideoxygalactose transaminase